MLLSSRMSVTTPMKEEVKLNWAVKNISLGYLQSEKVIFSPDFQTNIFSSEWAFYVYFTTESACLTVYLQRTYDSGPEKVSVEISNLKLQKLRNSAVLTDNRVLKNTFEKGGSCLLFKTMFYQEDILKASFEANADKLYVSCVLHPDSEFCVKENLLKLSSDMKALFENSILYDTILESSDGETYVHGAIIEARTSGLRSQTKRKNGNVSRIPLKNISESVVKGVFHYLYCAQLEEECSLSEQFLKDAAKYHIGIYDYELKFVSCSPIIEASTIFKGERKTFCVRLDRTKAENIMIRKFTLLNTEWSCEIQYEFQETGEKVNVRINPIPVVFGIDFDIRFVITMQNFCGTNLASQVAYIKMKKDAKCFKKPFKTSLMFEKGDDDSITTIGLMRNLLFSMEVWKGQTCSFPVTSFSSAACSSPTRRMSMDILLLSNDLLKLFEYSVHTDAIFRLPDGELKIHRAILSARSPVFAKYFELDMKEKATGVIEIKDIDTTVMTMLLKYVYSGQLVFGTIEEVIQLTYAADKYELTNLKDGCLRHLLENMDIVSALAVYVLLDFLQENDHKNSLRKYILQAYFNSDPSALREFRSDRPDLFDEIFNERTLRSTSKNENSKMSQI